MRRYILIIAVMLLIIPVVALADGAFIEFVDGRSVEASSCRVEGDDIFYTMLGSSKEYRTNFDEVVRLSSGELSTYSQGETPLKKNLKDPSESKTQKNSNKTAQTQNENNNAGEEEYKRSKVLSPEGLDPQQKKALEIIKNYYRHIFEREEKIREISRSVMRNYADQYELPYDFKNKLKREIESSGTEQEETKKMFSQLPASYLFRFNELEEGLDLYLKYVYHEERVKAGLSPKIDGYTSQMIKQSLIDALNGLW